MRVSHSHKPFNAVDYYPLPNGYADVYLHRNQGAEVDEEGSTIYKAEEVYFQISQDVTKEQIEANFDCMWEDAERSLTPPTLEERLDAVENAMLDLILGGDL